MKGQLAAAIVAAKALPDGVPITLLITTDEETTKAGAREIAQRSKLAKAAMLRGILVAEPTKMVPMRGHRVHVQFTATATGVQAHSSTGLGRNANWALVPFLMDMKAIYEMLRADPKYHDTAYDPPFNDFNPIIDNHGAAVNVTVPKATAVIKFRYSAKTDPAPIQRMVREAAKLYGLTLTEAFEGDPPELPESHPFVQLCSARQRRGAARRALWHRRIHAAGPGAVRGHGPRRYRQSARARRMRAGRGTRRRGAGVHAACHRTVTERAASRRRAWSALARLLHSIFS